MTRRRFFASLFAVAIAAASRVLPAAKRMAALPAPDDVGITLRMVEVNGAWRMDVLYGNGFAPRQEICCRVIG